MKKGHGPAGNTPLKAVPNHQVVPGLEGRDKAVEAAEIITVVGVAHDHEGAGSRLDPGQKGGAIALARHIDHPRPGRYGNLGGPI